MKWFKHENTFNNPKIEILTDKCGIIAYAIYFKVLELLANSIEESNISEWGFLPKEYNSQYLAKKIGTTPEELEKVLSVCYELGLFVNENERLYCPKILERCDDYTQRLLLQSRNKRKLSRKKVGTNSEESPTKNRIEENRIEENNKNVPVDPQRANPQEKKEIIPYSRPDPPKWTQIQRIGYYFEDKLRTRIVNWGKESQAAKKMLQAGFTEPEILKVIDYMAEKDEFFRGKGFDLVTVSNQITRYKAEASKQHV